jgi:type IV secretion system protein VirB5
MLLGQRIKCIMSNHTIHAEAEMTPHQAILTDQIGNEVYASHYAERKLIRFIIGTETVLLLGAFGLIFSLSNRPVANRYIRIDEMGRAQAIQYSDLNYSPREGEIRTYLTDWANYRYTISRDAVAKKYPLNYYFFSQTLATKLMTDDNQSHLVSQVIAGQIEQCEVEVKNVTITSMSEETVQGASMARGSALVTIDKLYSSRTSREPRTEHWLLSVTYYLNKYLYNFWRPETAIHAAATDGNPNTDPDPDWAPFITTPCFPSYPSNHGSAVNAAGEVLRRLYGEAGHWMTLTTPSLPNIVLRYYSFKEIENDVSDARVYGGIHFRTDQEAGADLGRAVGTAVYKNNLRPVHDDE